MRPSTELCRWNYLWFSGQRQRRSDSLNPLQIKMREEAEAKREAEQEAMREKILAKYRAAGAIP